MSGRGFRKCYEIFLNNFAKIQMYNNRIFQNPKLKLYYPVQLTNFQLEKKLLESFNCTHRNFTQMTYIYLLYITFIYCHYYLIM